MTFLSLLAAFLVSSAGARTDFRPFTSSLLHSSYNTRRPTFAGCLSAVTVRAIFVVNKFVLPSQLVDQFPKYLERQDILPCAGSAARR